MKFKTVKEGEQALVLDLNGQGTILEGPQRVNFKVKPKCLHYLKIVH